MNTGEVIKFLRKRENLTQQALADLLGVKKSSVQKYECGSVQNLKLETIQNLCKIFRVSPYAFIFPGLWGKSQSEYSNIPDLYKYAGIYYRLTDEGKQKILDYVEDIGEAVCYVRKDVEDYEELHNMFLQIGKGQEPN